MKSIQELAHTGASSVQGTTVGTKYGLQPIQFLKEINNAAKNQLFFANFVGQHQTPPGTHDVVIPKRTTYEGRSGMSFNTAELTTANTAMTFTTMDNLASVIITPTMVLSGYAITKYALRTNALNLVEAARDELSYAIGDRLDQAIAVAIGDAQDAGDTTLGAQSLYGGDANSDASGQLATGDVITTDLVAKAARYLKTTVMKYRASGGYGAESTATNSKNPWGNTQDDPFVFFIGPAQEETFRKDSQFVNAAEYGGNEVVRNGEIGQYLGIKIVVTNNVESVASGGTGPISGSATGTDSTLCILMKPKAACAVAWGRRPEVKVWDHNEQDQVRISLVCEYAIGIIHPDAIVFVSVADA